MIKNVSQISSAALPLAGHDSNGANVSTLLRKIRHLHLKITNQTMEEYRNQLKMHGPKAPRVVLFPSSIDTIFERHTPFEKQHYLLIDSNYI